MASFLIQVDGAKIPLDSAPRSLDEACRALGCGGIEVVSGVREYEGVPAQLIVDEEHALKALPLNNAAIAIRDMAFAAAGITSGDPIFGPVLLLTGDDRLR